MIFAKASSYTADYERIQEMSTPTWIEEVGSLIGPHTLENCLCWGVAIQTKNRSVDSLVPRPLPYSMRKWVWYIRSEFLVVLSQLVWKTDNPILEVKLCSLSTTTIES